MPAEQIFRPTLNSSEVAFITSLLKEHAMTHPVTAKFVLLEFKINSGIAKPVYVTPHRPSTEEKLGIVSADKPDYKTIRSQAHDKWKVSPQNCTLLELEHAMTYRFENELMNSEEAEKYISASFSSSISQS